MTSVMSGISNEQKKSKLIAKLEEGALNLDILGFICWWNVREITLTRDQFIAALKASGIDEKYAREHNYRSALIRALRGLEEEKIIRAVHEDRVNIVFQFTAEVKVEDPENPSLKYNPEVTITVDKEAYSIFDNFRQSITKVTDLKTKEESTKAEEIKNQITEAFDREKSAYKSSDITRYLQAIFVDNADIISLRQQGSVYFVPATFRPIVDKVKALSAQLSSYGTCQFQSVPIPDASDARKMVGDSFAEELASTLAALDKEIKDNQGGDKKVTEKWVDHRLGVIKKAKQRIDMYYEVLGEKANSISGQFDALANILKPRALEV